MLRPLMQPVLQPALHLCVLLPLRPGEAVQTAQVRGSRVQTWAIRGVCEPHQKPEAATQRGVVERCVPVAVGDVAVCATTSGASGTSCCCRQVFGAFVVSHRLYATTADAATTSTATAAIATAAHAARHATILLCCC